MARAFTLMELLIVALILALTSAFVLPRLVAYPHRMMVENALAQIRQACAEAAMRSRATGIPLNLVLDQESHCFLVEENTGTPAAEWEPPISDEALDAARDALQSKESYPLSTAIEWQFDGEEEYCLQFFPDGQAFGLPIQFQIGSQQFQFDIDRLSGNAQVMELNAR